MSEKHVSPDESTHRTKNKRLGKLFNKTFQCLSVLVLPLMFGIFTIVISVHQQNVAREQRLEDQREAQLQRKQEWDIATLQREAERDGALNRYRDELLANYIREIGDLLERKNGSLTADPLTAILARSKTLTILPQLDETRQIYALRALYDAKQLTQSEQHNPLDISSAKLANIDLRMSTVSHVFEKVSLAGVYIRNCTFSQAHLKQVNFSYAQLENVNFAFYEPDANAQWLTKREIIDVDFSSATLVSVNFSTCRLDKIKFTFARLTNVNFARATLLNVDFSAAKSIENLDFSNANLVHVNFSRTSVCNTSFSSADLYHSDFSSASLSDVYFTSTFFKSADFTKTRFGYCQILQGKVHFVSATLKTTIFTAAQFAKWSTVFDRCNFTSANFVLSICPGVQFQSCNLPSAVFSHADARSAHFHSSNLINADFSFANLPYTDFTNAIITDEQLQQALSIDNAKLPHGGKGQPRNLIRNGDPNCQVPLAAHWQLDGGSVAIVPVENNGSVCRFVLQLESPRAVMRQRVNLIDVWNSSIWTQSHAKLSTSHSNGVSMELRAQDSNGTIVNWLDIGFYTELYQLHPSMHTLELLIKFQKPSDAGNRATVWCDNINLCIDYDKTS